MSFLSFPALPKQSSLGCMTQSPLGALLVATNSLSLISSSSPSLFSDPVTFTATYSLSISDTVTFTTLLGGTTGTLGTASMTSGVAALTTTTLLITEFFYPTGIGGELIQAHLSSGVASGIIVQHVIYPQRLVVDVSFEINGFPFRFPLEVGIIPNDIPIGVEGDVFILQGSGATRVGYWSSTISFPSGSIGDIPGLPGETILSIVVQAAISADTSSTSLTIFIQPESAFSHANFSQLWTASDGQPWQNVRGDFSYVGPHSPTAELAPSSDSMHVAIPITATSQLSERNTMTASGTVS